MVVITKRNLQIPIEGHNIIGVEVQVCYDTHFDRIR